ncbi:MAG: hypothetical protein H0T42_32940 [Deltaproteobacteria bacterium]|nr:hypothetical protein [Deltaproteobacteria bacterium]
MNRTLIHALAVSTSLLTGCAGTDDAPDVGADEDTSDDQLITQLAAGKADGTDEIISASNNRIQLAGAPARQLYVLMDADGAQVTTIAGYRILHGRRTACITDGIGTYCDLRGQTDSEAEDGFAAGLHGNTTTSASSYLLRLLRTKTGSTASTVSVPWFRCVRQGGVWCGIEEPRALELTFDKLPSVGPDFVYEGWIILDGATTTSRFATTTALTQYVPASLAAATAYVLTIEPRRNDPAPASGTHIVAAALTHGSPSALTTEHAAAIGTDFATAAAQYILATPSTASMTDNNLGVWFVAPGGPEALMLPTLPLGWIYEGWVVNASGPVTTGRFRSGMGADSDGAGPTAGPLAGPPRPGQDFIMPPRDLVGGRVVITVEPEPDTAAAPFAIRPLVDLEVTALAPPATQMLDNTHAERPSGTVVLN